MARIKPQEIIRRDAIPSRRAEVPVLAIHADQDHTRYSGLMGKIGAHGAALLGQIHVQRTLQKNNQAEAARIKQAEDDFNEGGALRLSEDMQGVKHALPEYILEEASEDWRRGYHKTDVMVRIRDWYVRAGSELAQAEPDADYSELVQASKSELLQHPAFQDPQTRQFALEMLDGADQKLYQQHLKTASAELLARQAENLTALIRDRIESGVPVSDEMIDGFYELLNQPEYGYLNQRHVDSLLSDALVESLSQGRVDHPELIEFLENRQDADGVSIMDGAHGERIRNAAKAGQHALDRKAAEAAEQLHADSVFELDNLARRGLMTHSKINEWVERIGLSGNQARTFRQYWAGQQRQTEERWARDAEKRRQDAWQREMFENNSLFLSKSQLVAQLDKEWLGAHTPEQQRTVLQRGIDRGVVPSFISNMLNRADASNAESFQEANALYQEIRGLSPKIALNAAGDMAAKYEQYHADVTVGGLPPDAILSRFSLPKQERDIASFSVGQIFKDEAEDKYTEVTMGDLTFQRTPRERFLARQEAERIVAESPGISAEIAIKMAFERLDNQHSVINGQRVPNRGLRMNAEEGVTALVQGIENSLGVESETYTARPLDGGNNQYVIVDASGFPVTDPDTGTRIVFDPNQIGGHYEQWRHAQGIARMKLEKAAALERNLAAARTPNYAHAQVGLPLYDHEAIERMSQELEALKAELDTSDARDVQSRIQELKLEEAQLLAGYTAYPVGAESTRFNQSRLKAVRAELKSLSNTGGVPDDFMTYLQRQ